MSWICALALSIGITWSSGYNLNVQNRLVADVLKHFYVTHCIWLLDLDDVLISKKMKYVANNNIFTVAMADDDLSQYLSSETPFVSHKEAIVGDLDSLEWKLFMSQTYHSAEMSKMVWIIFFTGNLETMKRLHIPYNCQFILAYEESFGYGLYEFYQLKGRVTFAGLGTWTPDAGLRVSNEPFYNRRLNFYGALLTMLRSEEDASDYELAHLDIWFSMGRMMNFSTRVFTKRQLKKEKKWITLDVSSQVTVFHAIGLLRNPYLLFSISPIWKISMFMYVRREDDSNSKWMAFIRPFTTKVWQYLTLTIFISSTCIVIIYRRRSFRQILEVGLIPVDSLTNQCGSYIGRSYSKRIVNAVTRLLAIIVIPAYSGVIISTLTFKYPNLPFSDLGGLVSDGSYKLGAVNTSFGLGYFEYSQNPLAQKVAIELFVDEETMPTSYQEGLTRSCLERFAFLAPEDAIAHANVGCEILKLPTPAFTTFAGMPLSPYSEFKSVFFRSLMLFRSAGIINKLGAKRQLEEIKSYDQIEVTLDHICPLLILCLVGLIASILILFLEMTISKPSIVFNSRKKNKFIARKRLLRLAQSELRPAFKAQVCSRRELHWHN